MERNKLKCKAKIERDFTISCDMRDLLNLSDFNAINDHSSFVHGQQKKKLEWKHKMCVHGVVTRENLGNNV